MHFRRLRSALWLGGCVLAPLLMMGGSHPPRELRVGIAGHAFDHLGNLGGQGDAAIASGANILYATGIGGDGYSGLPAPDVLQQHLDASRRYAARCRSNGVQRMIGYVCATSIVGLETFDAHWSGSFRGRFRSPPADWRQQDRDGRPLKSWYAGQYEPACMNHPDWREYERQMVRLQLEAGHDGIFFDNPTVHEHGCYCPHCLNGFARFLRGEGQAVGDTTIVAALRQEAVRRPKEFLRYRATIARDFLAEMRRFARTIRRDALITCNNSLNSPEVLFSQSRGLGYNLFELSKTEDFVVVEDMATQPRVLRDGRVLEYGSLYRQLHALSHGKPVVAVTIAEADYHSPARLVRLAMAEAAAHEASYLSWPTWPEAERTRMAAAVRPQADFLRHQERWLNETQPRRDAVLYLPFQRWIETNVCVASAIARVLTRSNIQYEVLAEEDWDRQAFRSHSQSQPVWIFESPAVLTESQKQRLQRYLKHGGSVIDAHRPDWVEQLKEKFPHPSLEMVGPSTVRGVLRDGPHGTVLHLYNLNVERLDSFTDTVRPEGDLQIRCRVPVRKVHSVTALSADPEATRGSIPFSTVRLGSDSEVTFRLPHLEISTLVVIE